MDKTLCKIRATANRGFTLLELLITIAIIAVLMAIAIPSYQNYIRRAYYTEIIQAAAPYKLAIAECFQMTGQLHGCKDSSFIKPIANSANGGLVNKIIVDDTSKITVIPNPKHGITANDIYELIPRLLMAA